MTVVEQFVEKYNLRQKKYIDLSFVGDAYDYATFELAVSDINANITTNALTNGTTGAVRVFKGEEISVIRLLQDIELTVQTVIQNNTIVDFNGFTMTEIEGYTSDNFLISKWIEGNSTGVVYYARKGGAIQTNNRIVSIALIMEYSAVIGLTINCNNYDGTNNSRPIAIRIGNTTEANSCNIKSVVEDCNISMSLTDAYQSAGVAGLYDLNAKDSKVTISNTKIVINNEDCCSICQGVLVQPKEAVKNLKMINCKVEVNTTQEAGTPSGVSFEGHQLTMIDCYAKVKSSNTNALGVTQDGSVARLQNTDIIALSPNLKDKSAIGISNSSTLYLKDTNVFGVTSGISNHGILYIDGGYLRAPGHGGLYNSDNVENTGAKAYLSGVTLAQAIDELQEFGATCTGSSGATYNAYGCYTWFDNCTFKGAEVVCKYSTDETDDDDKGANVYISNSYSELGYRCDKGTTLTLGTGVTGSASVTGTGGVGTVNHTNDDYSEIAKMNIPSELYATVADYLNDLNKARIDLANLSGANELATISTLADKLVTAIDEVYTKGYEKGKSEGGGGLGDILISNACSIRFNNDDWVEGDTFELNMPNLNNIATSFYFSFKKIKTLIITSETPITQVNDCFYIGDNSIIEKIVFNCDFSKCTSFARWFRKHQKLKSVEGNPINFSSATQIGGVFSYCSYIESFRIAPKSIKANISFDTNGKLSGATIQSIIDGLADLTGGTAQTLAFHADVKARLTEEQLAAITGKNWTIA